MGKTSYQLRIKPTNKAKCVVKRDLMNERCHQLNDAVQWCHENNKRGWAAINSGKFPLIKDLRTINKRLDGVIETGKEKQYCSIFTVEEEESIVRHVKNKNRYTCCKNFFLFLHFFFLTVVFLTFHSTMKK